MEWGKIEGDDDRPLAPFSLLFFLSLSVLSISKRAKLRQKQAKMYLYGRRCPEMKFKSR